MTDSLVLDVLRTAIKARSPKPGLIHHTVRGGQYVSNAYKAMQQLAGSFSTSPMVNFGAAAASSGAPVDDSATGGDGHIMRNRDGGGCLSVNLILWDEHEIYIRFDESGNQLRAVDSIELWTLSGKHARECYRHLLNCQDLWLSLHHVLDSGQKARLLTEAGLRSLKNCWERG